MNKPILLAREEFAEQLVALINNSQLPIYVVEPIISSLSTELKNQMQQQYLREKQEYEDSLENQGNSAE